ncbi:uncharacterized protein EV420DRAFT_151810 [Desarmillaria tabescens]|uniref:Uncharacterized protein n=1 Tax=Armillaria tabescens TaxID=1929756 RepID=A0AA39JB82_ARMTA|nr:uncharacterized protein EV420DRAFT_151810 [Desarmillaria tabescens]KAK0438159.1 hypothetical protein EV420DRAFT_151810 [Desarmillaria tabescens]
MVNYVCLDSSQKVTHSSLLDIASNGMLLFGMPSSIVLAASRYGMVVVAIANFAEWHCMSLLALYNAILGAPRAWRTKLRNLQANKHHCIAFSSVTSTSLGSAMSTFSPRRPGTLGELILFAIWSCYGF